MRWNDDQPKPPHYPIWYVVFRRDPAMPLSNYGVSHVLACIAGDLADLDALYARNVARRVGIGAVIFTRSDDSKLPGMVEPDSDIAHPAKLGEWEASYDHARGAWSWRHKPAEEVQAEEPAGEADG